MEFPITELMDEDACYQKLLHCLHPNGLACPRCGASDGLGVHRRNLDPILDYRCTTCRRVFNALTGTALQGTRRPVVELMLILRGFAQGVPNARLARELGCDRKRLLTLRHRLRHAAWRCRDQSRLDDPVAEADAMYQDAGERRPAARRPARPAAAAREQGPRPSQLGQRPGAGLWGRAPRQRSTPAVGGTARRQRDAEPGGEGCERAAGTDEHRRLAGV